MNTTNQDPWIHEDDADETSAPVITPAPASALKPKVFSDPTIPTLVLPEPEIAAEKSSASKPEAEPDANEFPNDYGECLKIGETFFGADKLSASPTAQQVARYKKFMRLKAHMNAIQQGFKSAPFDPGEHARNLAQHVLSGDRARASIAESHRFSIAANAFSGMSVTPRLDVPEAVKGALKDEAIIAQVNDCRLSVSGYCILFFENWNVMNVRQRQKELRYSYRVDIDFDSAKKLAQESMQLHSPAAIDLAAHAKRMLSAYFEKNCKPKLLTLLQSVISHIEAAQAKARQAEKEFFASQGEKHSSTSVSRKFDLIIERLRDRQNRILNPPPSFQVGASAINPENTLLAEFGLKIIE